jgi:hypothetical protein
MRVAQYMTDAITKSAIKVCWFLPTAFFSIFRRHATVMAATIVFS